MDEEKLTSLEVAKMLGRSVSWLQQKRYLLPFQQLVPRGKCLFNRRDVELFLERAKNNGL